MPNRLAGATSPYLLQHADNPVDWWPWSEGALAESRRREVPILLSIGYAACHWCHVMAHESFEDQPTASTINASFVAIKVDREERPDLDAVYLRAVQAMTGQGGWPATLFLTPGGEPFYAGTYFPPVPGHGLPAFGQVLEAVAEAWRDRREEVLVGARSITGQLSAVDAVVLSGDGPTPDPAAAVGALRQDFDPVDGGFGRAPKFPPSMVIEALLRDGSEAALAMVTRTLDAMAAGGLHDQLAGGFARYSVDTRWTVPHFEKMLYDNALLLGCYTHAYRRLGPGPSTDRYADVVARTVDWLTTELRTPEGAFAASLDADSVDPDDPSGHPVEGAYYVWTPQQLVDVLGPADGAWAADVFGVGPDGSFEHGRSTLTRRRPVDDPDRLATVTTALRRAREQRPRPGRDDKVVAAWNGWLIGSLVEAGMVFERPDWVELARTTADYLWRVHRVDARLRRTSRDGTPGSAAGILEDHAALVLGFVRLAEATGEAVWVDRSVELATTIDERFGAADGGFFDTAADAETLVARPRDPADNATPSGLSCTVHALDRLGSWTGEDRWTRRAARAAGSASDLVRRAPRFAGWLLADAVTRARPAVQVAVVGGPGDPATAELTTLAWRLAPGGSVVVSGVPDADGIPLLADRTLVDQRPAGYVCRHFVCRLPVTDPAALAAELRVG